MIITIISVALLIIGIAIIILEGKYILCKDCWFGVGVIASVIGGMATIICIIGILTIHVPKEIDYQNALYEKEVIEYRIENIDENLVGNEFLYNDVVTFNNELRKVKMHTNNLWVNWFWNEKIATIDYIDFELE